MRYNCIRDKNNSRNPVSELRKCGSVHISENSSSKTETLPLCVDLRSNFPDPPYDQGQLNSCTANALISLVMYYLKIHDLPCILKSRLYLYWYERYYEGVINENTGTSIADGIRVLHKHGICNEELWPYKNTMFMIKPSLECDLQSNTCRDIDTRSISSLSCDIELLKKTLSEGFPIAFGMSVYESFESTSVTVSGIVPIPLPNEKLLGGHAVVLCGYDDSKGMFLVRNSWGVNWGQEGYFELPYEYFIPELDYVFDFWTIRNMEITN